MAGASREVVLLAGPSKGNTEAEFRISALAGTVTSSAPFAVRRAAAFVAARTPQARHNGLIPRWWRVSHVATWLPVRLFASGGAVVDIMRWAARCQQNMTGRSQSPRIAS